jgi:hypothetical protein
MFSIYYGQGGNIYSSQSHMIRNFKVEIERSVDLDALGWPERGTAGEDGLRCNRAYIDLRGLSWVQSQAVLA